MRTFDAKKEVMITFRCTGEWRRRLRIAAASRGAPMAELIIAAVDRYLAETPSVDSRPKSGD